MNYTYTLAILIVSSLLFVKCNNADSTANEQDLPTQKDVVTLTESSTPTYTVNVFDVENNQFGYDILMNGEPYIHQPHIPAIGGNSGFLSKEKAEIAGNYIIQKLNNNIIPPTISLNELDSLNVLN